MAKSSSKYCFHFLPTYHLGLLHALQVGVLLFVGKVVNRISGNRMLYELIKTCEQFKGVINSVNPVGNFLVQIVGKDNMEYNMENILSTV